MRNLDKLIAEKVMGFEIRYGNIVRDNKRSGIPPYSQKIEFAWKVVEKMQESNVFCISDIKSNGETDYMAEFFLKDSGEWIKSIAKTAPLAICKAALKTVERGEVIG